MKKMNKMFRSALISAVAAMSFTTVAFASVDQTGTISQIIVEGSNIVSVWLNGTYPASECSGGRWTIQNNDPLFNQKVATLLAAASAGKTVLLRSTGTCGQWNSNMIYLVGVTY